jgi:serine/threonine-protein kinase PpkA
MTQANSISIPGYRIVRKLGHGGMATVYLAIQESFDREVAMKIMSPFLNSDPSFTTRFVREARIVAQIHHASIVPVMDVGEHQTHHYLSMEYLPGGDLKHRISQGKHGLSLAINTCTAISSALDVAHRKGFVHRDIKPENILFREDGTPVLTDFGIARAIDAGTSLTMAGMMVGTPNYMSPEQVKGQELDGRSDLYSLGIVFFETLTGMVPFRADSSLSLALKHLSDPLPPLPPEFGIYQPFMDRLTAKEREDRFASGAEVTRALRLISEMAQPRAVAAVRAVQTPTLVPMPATSPTMLAMTVDDPQPTLLATQRSVSLPAAPSVPAASEPAASTAAVPSAFIPDTARAPASSAVRRPIAARARAVLARCMASLRSPAMARILRVSTPRWSMLLPSLRSVAGNPRMSRQVVWATVGVAAVALGSGGYFFSRPATSPQASELRPASVVAVQTTAPIPAPQPEQEIVSAETLSAVQQVAADGEALRALEAVVEQTRIKQERELKAAAVKQRREEDRQRRRQEEETRKAELLRKNEELRRANELRISELLAAAKKDYAENRLLQPSGNNAAERYREVLRLNAAQAEALAGLRKIADLFAAEAERSLLVGRAVTASTLITNVRELQPKHPQLPILEARLEEIQSSPVALAGRQQSALEKSEKAIAKAYEALERKPLSYKAVDAAADQFDRAQKLAPEAPGLELLKDRIIVSFAAATQAEWDSNDRKDAQRIVDMAKQRQWLSTDLEQWEATLKAAGTNRK